MGRETVREAGGVRYHLLQARSLLNRCTSPHIPFEWTVNPYRGCAMGCRYCYAAYTHEFMGITVAEEFHSVIYAKTGAEAETARGLPNIVRRGQMIALGTVTDPYQPGESDLRVTRRFLESVAQHRNLRLGITTKGALILRDLDLLQRIQERSHLSVHVSLISPRAEFLRQIEPWAAAPEVRIEVMRRLREAGIDVSLSLAPVLPALTDHPGDLDALLGQVRAAGVERLSWNILFLRSPTREKYLGWLARAFPQYLEAYRHAYADRVYLGGRYRERLRTLLQGLRAKHGLARAFAAGSPREGRSKPPSQLPLWA